MECFTASAVDSVTRKQKLCSDDDCEIIKNTGSCIGSGEKSASGNARYTDHAFATDGEQTDFFDAGDRSMTVALGSPVSPMSVPGYEGLKVLRTRMGMALSSTG